MEKHEAELALLKEQQAGIDAANGLLMDALLLVIRQRLPALLPPMARHFQEMAAQEQLHLSQTAQDSMRHRAAAIQQKFQLLERLPSSVPSGGPTQAPAGRKGPLQRKR